MQVTRAAWFPLAPTEPRCEPKLKGAVTLRCGRFMAGIFHGNKVIDYSARPPGCSFLCEGFRAIDKAARDRP